MNDAIISLRARLHATPERSGGEAQTLEAIHHFLSENTSLTLERRDGWLLATRREGDGLSETGFRSELDAVPLEDGGACHRCGHDGHSAILCALALALEGKRIGKNLRLIFQGAEETGEGAKRVCEDWPGLQNLSRLYALHNIPGYPKGALLVRRGCFACASEGFVVDVTGRPAHAAYPGDGANPAELLSRLTLALPDMISDILRGDGRLLMHTVIGMRLGGENFGMSASDGRLCLTLRGYRQADIDALSRRIVDFVEAGCEGEGMTCRFDIRDAFPDTTNHPEVVDAAVTRFRGAGLPVIMLDAPMRWSEDFGWYLRRVPGMYFGIGAGEDCPGLHTAGYAFDDDLIEPAVRALCTLL